MFSPLLSIKRQLGFRLFTGEDLNAISNRVNLLGASVANTVSAITNNVGVTYTGAQLISGTIARSGPTAAFTDTLPIAANIDAALGAAAQVGTAFGVYFQNTTAFAMTLAAASGVTISGQTLVQPNSINEYVLTVTTAPKGTTPGVYTLTFLSASAQDSFAANSFIATADNGTTQTLTAAMVVGGQLTYHTSAGGTTPSLTLPLGTAMDTALPALPIGQSYTLRIINNNSGVATIVTNTGWTLTGTLTLAASTWREFVVTRTAAGTYTGVNVGTGTNS